MMDLKETRAVRSVLKGFDPHIAIDMHEYWALASSPTYNYTHAADGMYATAKNLNIHESIRKLSDEFIRDLSWRMLGSGLRAEPYVTRNFTPFPSPDYAVALVEAGSEPRIGRNAVGLMQTLSFLLETRGIGLTTQEYQRRTASGLTMLSSIIGYAANASDFVRSTIAEARKSFIVSNEPIVVTDYTTTDIRHFKMVDTHNGSVVDLPVRFESSSPVTANLTRARPEAYLIPPAWDSIARRLEAAGVEVHQVHNPWNGPVEVLTITSATTNKHFYWERGPTTTLTTSASEQNVSLPAGSWLVSTRQRNAALAMAALEPEGINSLASFQIIPMSQWQEYPIFRIMQN